MSYVDSQGYAVSGATRMASGLFASLPAFANRLGGSDAQRDVMHPTLLQGIELIRRPLRRSIDCERASEAAWYSGMDASKRVNGAARSASGD
jgi:hypothetical protein